VDPWPATATELLALQEALAALRPPPWRPLGEPRVGACFVCFPRGESGAGARGDRAFAAAALAAGARLLETACVEGKAGAPYRPGLLALREGRLLAAAVLALAERPDVLLVDGTGRDHPRRAGLALHLGWALAIPSVGVTHRPLAAHGEWPPARRGARAALRLGPEQVGYWLCTREGTRPLAVHAGWRTDPEVAAEVVLASSRVRTPEPLRQARRVARRARSHAGTA